MSQGDNDSLEMRPIFRLAAREPRKPVDRGQVEEIARRLARYLVEYYKPERFAYSKHGLLGPVGKLLAVAASGRFDGPEGLLGFVTSVHTNTSKKDLDADGIRLLRDAVESLFSLRRQLSPRDWLRVLRDLEYRVYFLKYEDVAQRVAEKARSGEDSQA